MAIVEHGHDSCLIFSLSAPQHLLLGVLNQTSFPLWANEVWSKIYLGWFEVPSPPVGVYSVLPDVGTLPGAVREARLHNFPLLEGQRLIDAYYERKRQIWLAGSLFKVQVWPHPKRWFQTAALICGHTLFICIICICCKGCHLPSSLHFSLHSRLSSARIRQ